MGAGDKEKKKRKIFGGTPHQCGLGSKRSHRSLRKDSWVSRFDTHRRPISEIDDILKAEFENETRTNPVPPRPISPFFRQRRSTRSQVAPDWNPTDELILVNEVAAVEADCLKALSSFQKWKIIAQNCFALGVSRTLDQYRRKWDALFCEYKGIKQWEAKSRSSDSYWVLGIERRKRNGLPENFDQELYRGIDRLVRVRGNQSDTDPDSDPEDEAEAEPEGEPDVDSEPESKRRKRRSIPQKSCPKENSFRSCKREKPRETHAQEKPLETHAEEKPLGSGLKAIPTKSLAEEQPQKSCVKKKLTNSQRKEEAISIEEQEKIAAMKMHESAELIRAIITEKPDHEAAGVKSTGDLQTDFVRWQGDRVIACLGDIVKTLDQLRHLVQECE